MGSFEMSLFVNRPPQDVFDYVTNTDNDKNWQKGLISSQWITPEPLGVGSIKRVVTKFMGRELEADVEYTKWDRPNGYTFEAATGPFTVVGNGRFEAQDEGTLITMGGVVDISGILGLLEGLMIGQIKKQDTENFQKLKELLEAE